VTERLVRCADIEPGMVIAGCGAPLLVDRIIPVETPDAMRAHGIEYRGVAVDRLGNEVMLTTEGALWIEAAS
jgi:hypothetical protein